MKNLRIYIGLVILFATFSSCESFVDFKAADDYKITDVEFLRSEADYKSMVVSCYTPTQWLNQVMVVGDIASDDAVAGGENATDVSNLQQIDDYTTTVNNGHLDEIWRVAYEGVNRCNYILKYKDANLVGQTINFAGKEELYGEVKFLRAYYYFNLVKMFGDVVLFTNDKLVVTEFGKLQRSPKTAVYTQIEADLNAAIAVLPTTNAQKGRITKYAAQAMLGKVFLYENKFDQAATMLENVIVSGQFSLMSNYANQFLLANENGPESIYEVQYSNGSPYYNWGGATRGQGNYAVQQCGIRELNGDTSMPYASGWSTNLPTKNLANAYVAGDTRKDATCFDPDAYIAANPTQFIAGSIQYVASTNPAFAAPTPTKKPAYKVAPYKNTGLYNAKYLPRKGQTSGQTELNYDNNQRIIRYADVLLMAAEANNRATAPNDAKAKTYLDMVRSRAFAGANAPTTATGAALKQAIWDERRLELGMEGDRFFDLVRTGQAATKIPGFVAGKNEVFPIPLADIEYGLTQNPGW